MLYEVRAATPSAELTTLHLEAATADEARAQAVRLRLAPVSVKPHSVAPHRRRDEFDVTLFAEELRILLEAGLPVLEALDGLAERQTDAQGSSILRGLSEKLRQGEKLSQAMSKQVAVFPPLFTGIIQAAESTSSLPASLAKYVAHQRHLQQLRDRITSATLYPGILLVVGSAVTLFLMVYVVPRFAAVYRSGGRSLPLASQVLLEAGDWLGQHVVLVLAAAVIAAFGVWSSMRRRAPGERWIWLAGAWPALGRRLATVETARMYRTLGMLLQGGLPMRQSMLLAGSVTFGGRRDALDAARLAVEGGQPLSESLAQHGLATPLALRLLKVGEQGGRLGDMLERAAEFHEHETALWMERFSRVFGPALMVLISLVVGVVVVLLYVPVFDLAGSLQ